MADEIETTTCPFCHGTGRRADGSECDVCGGTKQLPVDHMPPESPLE